MSTYQIFTLPQTLTNSQLAIIVARKSSKTKQVKESEKHRSIILEADHFEAEEVSSQFRPLVASALADTAKSVLESYIQSNPMAREIPADLMTIPSLLAHAALVRESQRLTKESLDAWFRETVLAAWIAENKGDRAATLINQYSTAIQAAVKMDSIKALGLDTISATLSALTKFEEDADTPMGQAVLTKFTDALESLQTAVTWEAL